MELNKQTVTVALLNKIPILNAQCGSVFIHSFAVMSQWDPGELGSFASKFQEDVNGVRNCVEENKQGLRDSKRDVVAKGVKEKTEDLKKLKDTASDRGSVQESSNAVYAML